MNILKNPVLLIISSALSLAVHADIIASYDFAGGSALATSADVNLTANDVTVGPGLTTTAGFSGSGHNAFARTTGTFGTNISFGNASASDDYFSVIIGPNSGFTMSLDTITFDYGYSSIVAGDGDLRAYVTTSADSHAAFLDFDTVTSVTDNSGTFPVSSNTDLSGGAFQNLNTDIEFRIYLSDEYNVNDVIHRVDNVVVNGTITAIPEPGTTGLLGLGLLMMARLFQKNTV